MASPAPNWPDTQQMLEQLQSSGVLRAQTPMGPIQPLPHPPEAHTTVHPQNLVGTTAVDHAETEIAVSLMDNPLIHKGSKLLGIALTFEGMIGIYLSLSFLFVEYPALEKELVTHHITLEEINHIAVAAIIETTSTVIGLLFAVKLTIFHTRASHIIHTILGFIFFVLNAMWMTGLLDQFNLIEPFTTAILSLLDLQ